MNPFRAGDVVRHRPTGEKWVLAYAEGDRVSPCGWPETIAYAAHCDMLEKASDAEHRLMLEKWAAKEQHRDRRSWVCQRQLFVLNEGFLGAGI